MRLPSHPITLPTLFGNTIFSPSFLPLFLPPSPCVTGQRLRRFIVGAIAMVLDGGGAIQIAQDDDPFGLVVSSLCPSIFGHEIVKVGLRTGGQEPFLHESIVL